VPHTVNSALWGKKDGGARPRVAVALIVAAVALAAPAIGRAADVPANLLSQAQANPDQSFQVIVQTAPSTLPPASTATDALTKSSRHAFDDALKAAQDASKKLDDLSKKVSDAAAKLADAQQKAARDPRKQSDVDRAQSDLNDAQAALAAAQAYAVLAQLALIQQQTRYTTSYGQAVSDIHSQYSIIPAVAAGVKGSDIVGLAADTSADVVAVTPDRPVTSTATENSQKWVDASGIKPFWASKQRGQALGRTPTIAVVDSGVDGSRVADFGGRMLGQVTLTSLQPNSPGDGRGHGTMVASLAAGGSDHRAGVDPDAPIISLDVLNDNGEGRTSDVIAAADWILANRLAYNIRVANFSLESAVDSSFLYDPLSQAVEKLWFNGVVVVAAAGNYADNGQASGVRYAPASDPFVITVGAVDIGNDGNTKNDVAAPWSAWGYTNDGFLKPDISAPGRYMIGACPQTATLCRSGGQDPKLLPQGYVQLSGTSFAAPLVSGAAAVLLALHPDWSPDQVKGQLMLTASPLPNAVPGSVGVGELNLKDALDSGRGKDANAVPPNPNLALDGFIAQTPAGAVFDAASWASTAQANASWNSASWASASWASASWNSASWNSASWASASWASASWASASWSSASWASASWASSAAGLSVRDNAALDGPGNG
jgi:serine protease AprX